MTDVAAILLGAAARGVVVLLVALVLTTLLQRRPAAVRHAIWTGAIAAQLLLVVLALWGPRWKVPVPEPLRSLVPEASIVTPVDQSRDVSPKVATKRSMSCCRCIMRADPHASLSAPWFNPDYAPHRNPPAGDRQ